MKLRKTLSLILAAALLISTAMLFAGCGSKADSDLKYVQNKGKLIVGVTDFAPCDYQKDGKWIGFDADLAREFGKALGVEVEFSEIEWDNKTLELTGKTIDVVWNGMTIDDEVKAVMDVSNPYLNNAQIVIVPKDKADTYKTTDSLKNLQFAVEVGSAGKKIAEANGYKFTEVDSQAKALLEVKSGTCTGAIIDSLMAAAMVGEGTDYADLAYTVGLTSEEYGVGFRKGSNMVAKLNECFTKWAKDGTIDRLAAEYGVTAAVIKK